MSSSPKTVDYFTKNWYYAKDDPEYKKASYWYGRGAKYIIADIVKIIGEFYPNHNHAAGTETSAMRIVAIITRQLASFFLIDNFRSIEVLNSY